LDSVGWGVQARECTEPRGPSASTRVDLPRRADHVESRLVARRLGHPRSDRYHLVVAGERLLGPAVDGSSWCGDDSSVCERTAGPPPGCLPRAGPGRSQELRSARSTWPG